MTHIHVTIQHRSLERVDWLAARRKPANYGGLFDAALKFWQRAQSEVAAGRAIVAVDHVAKRHTTLKMAELNAVTDSGHVDRLDDPSPFLIQEGEPVYDGQGCIVRCTVSGARADELDALAARSGVRSVADLINIALTVYDWAQVSMEAGREVASLGFHPLTID